MFYRPVRITLPDDPRPGQTRLQQTNNYQFVGQVHELIFQIFNLENFNVRNLRIASTARRHFSNYNVPFGNKYMYFL